MNSEQTETNYNCKKSDDVSPESAPVSKICLYGEGRKEVMGRYLTIGVDRHRSSAYMLKAGITYYVVIHPYGRRGASA